MDYRKEEKQKKKCLRKEFNKLIEKIEGPIITILFFLMIYLIKQVTPNMAKAVLMLEVETISTFFEIVLMSTLIGAVLVGLKKQMKKGE